MFRYAITIFGGLLLASCNTPTQPSQQQTTDTKAADTTKTTAAPSSAKQLIVPGKSIGLIKLNDDADRLIDSLGKPDGGDAGMGKAVSVWYADHDTSGYQTAIYSERQMGVGDEKSRVKQIRVTSPWFVTQEGLHTGSTAKELSLHYKLRKIAYFVTKGQRYELFDTGKGLTFEINTKDTCTAIIAHEADRQASGAYLPFYSNLKVINQP